MLVGRRRRHRLRRLLAQGGPALRRVTGVSETSPTPAANGQTTTPTPRKIRIKTDSCEKNSKFSGSDIAAWEKKTYLLRLNWHWYLAGAETGGRELIGKRVEDQAVWKAEVNLLHERLHLRHLLRQESEAGCFAATSAAAR